MSESSSESKQQEKKCAEKIISVDLAQRGYKIDFNDLLGKGTYSSVYKVDYSGEARAIKVISPLLKCLRTDIKACPRSMRVAYRKEWEVMRELRNPGNACVVSIYENFTKYHSMSVVRKTEMMLNHYIALEYADGNTLLEVVNSGPLITQCQAVPLMSDLVEGLLYLHTKQLYHHDVKPANYLAFKFGPGDFEVRFKLADFNSTTNEMVQKNVKGTPVTLCPEIHRMLVLMKLGKKTCITPYLVKWADLWSLGATIFFLLHKCYPLVDPKLSQEIRFEQMKKLFLSGNQVEPREIYEKRVRAEMLQSRRDLCPRLRHILIDMLEPNPRKRPHAVQALVEWLNCKKQNPIRRRCSIDCVIHPNKQTDENDENMD